ncbi:uncharacterized protein LOC107785659 [Nicotiana tabacum]|uniref:Uncharacterized protein isoform X2 n=3 Tax=Nicotiana tabacum TaxID=4097 RepID=A0A1S3ZDH4_TOBAC|nr:PREDICTED: uncharacterized protein LOC107785659 isoform X2 [Nicotiana tabacum]XP_016462497.1 PREDICTED: uncharacterized protein LOC107785659 isoform X2 [Nicotiana tabacum]
MYPIALAVIDQETKHSWSWFLSHLIQDLELGVGDGLTIMSDMQKGLVLAIQELLPNAERRMCARHIWANWQKIREMKQEEKLSGVVLRPILSLKKDQEQQLKQHQTVNLVLNNLVQLLKQCQ